MKNPKLISVNLLITNTGNDVLYNVRVIPESLTNGGESYSQIGYFSSLLFKIYDIL